MESASIPDPDWEHYFFSQFEGPEKLKTKLIRGLAARICSSNSALKKKIERRGNTPHYMILRDLKVHRIIEYLKYVAKDNKEVRELIVILVRNRESILGEERRENPAVEETPVFEDDEDGRTPMMLRARTFGKIVAEIGTTRSRRVERVMKRAEERRQLTSSSGDADEDCGTGLEVMVTVSGKSFWVADTTATGADDLKNRDKISRRGRRPANWHERLQYRDTGVDCGPPSRLPRDPIKYRARSLSPPRGRISREIRPQGRAKSEDNTEEKVAKLEDTSDQGRRAARADQSYLLEGASMRLIVQEARFDACSCAELECN